MYKCKEINNDKYTPSIIGSKKYQKKINKLILFINNILYIVLSFIIIGGKSFWLRQNLSNQIIQLPIKMHYYYIAVA